MESYYFFDFSTLDPRVPTEKRLKKHNAINSGNYIGWNDDFKMNMKKEYPMKNQLWYPFKPKIKIRIINFTILHE